MILDPDFVEVKELLEESVANYLVTNPKYNSSPESPGYSEEGSEYAESQEDIDSILYEEEYFEGGWKPRLSSYHERDPRLRSATISYHGTACKVCGFDFAKCYGLRGDGYIEVHHLIPVSSLSKKTRVNPIHDMTVLCSNCHRMIHRKKDNPLTPEQLAEILKLVGGC